MCTQNKKALLNFIFLIGPCIYSLTIKIMQSKNNTAFPNIMYIGRQIK